MVKSRRTNEVGSPLTAGAALLADRILTEALALANATSRSLFMRARDSSWYLYPDSGWTNYLFITGSEFETPIPEVTREGVKPFPPTGYRTLNCAHGLLLRASSFLI